ncbi:hypothetical protein UFOVP104_11 [uncultured Caudovirales phage]|uniref:Uncharacterized protein n=1 Tax=uncultured Caudovirales phage TaxID=2100421 RepID=A0A6J5KZU9_9CAUD|nr:hypothetical protein UFOVP104_11 [uncultured Caudovirales phage]CAB4134332.1 hypothetical protein UFOVP271_46 [uncultured Caudovirales phage]
MNIIERIKSKTPRKHKINGQISGVLGTVCATTLATGLVTNPIGIIALTVGSVIFGGKAVYHAQKVQK